MAYWVIKGLISGFWRNEKVKKPYFTLNEHSAWPQDVSGPFLEKSDLPKNLTLTLSLLRRLINFGHNFAKSKLELSKLDRDRPT